MWNFLRRAVLPLCILANGALAHASDTPLAELMAKPHEFGALVSDGVYWLGLMAFADAMTRRRLARHLGFMAALASMVFASSWLGPVAYGFMVDVVAPCALFMMLVWVFIGSTWEVPQQ